PEFLRTGVRAAGLSILGSRSPASTSATSFLGGTILGGGTNAAVDVAVEIGHEAAFTRHGPIHSRRKGTHFNTQPSPGSFVRSRAPGSGRWRQESSQWAASVHA